MNNDCFGFPKVKWYYCLLQGCLSSTHSFSVLPTHVAINHILPKLDSLDYIFRRNCRSSFSQFDAASKANIQCDDGPYAVQGHLRSAILVPIESPYATNFHHTLHRFQVTAVYWSNFRFGPGVPLSLTHWLGMNSYLRPQYLVQKN